MNNKFRMDICLSSDDNYAKYMGTVMISILKNSLEDEEIVFHLLDGGISDDNKNKLLSLKKIKNCEIYFYIPDIKKYEEWYLKGNYKDWSPATFYRLSIPSMIPNVDKILYLDCDVIVNLSLKELFKIDIGNYYALVCREHLKGDYFNSGVLMINNRLWRDTNIEDVFYEYYNKNYRNYSCIDQDLLNDILKGRVKLIDKKWNFFPVLYNKPLEMSINDYIESNKNSIIHYIMYKPWNTNSTALKSIFLNYYWKYYMLTPWSEDDKEILNILLKQQDNIYKDADNYEKKLLSIQQFINKIAWWIPIKKLRDKFRSKFF
ncbi:glycosyltransferase family 8 protein [Brachyspira murdochii]|uniref:glycosyltransferase family 8 protein n=1 Tax=Brachyspira murdochii TaxID=84378 RepID=UPI001E5012CE|nr:glycosyltransferase family 8 protein [Brachyspira murdochii]